MQALRASTDTSDMANTQFTPCNLPARQQQDLQLLPCVSLSLSLSVYSEESKIITEIINIVSIVMTNNHKSDRESHFPKTYPNTTH